MTTPVTYRPQARRPGAGVPVDPVQLMARRYLKGLTRPQLSAAIEALGMTYDNGAPVRAGKDHLGKIERGQNKPSLEVMQAMCAVLGCDPRDLLPGGPRPDVPDELIDRMDRLDYNQDLREFASQYGLRYKSRRVYYNLRLQEAYAAHEALEAAMRGRDKTRVREAKAAFEAALEAAPRLPGAKAAA